MIQSEKLLFIGYLSLFMKKIILASQSPRRQQMLRDAGIDFSVETAHTIESYSPHLPPKDVPIHIAKQKAEAVWNKMSNEEQNHSLVIAADTIVVLESEILSKPKNIEDACLMLQKLSGKLHKVITGVALKSKDKYSNFSDITEVHFYPLEDTQISYYVNQYMPLDKAGAYAIQEWIGLIGIEKIVGNYHNVVGMPMSKLLTVLKTEWQIV